LALDSLFGDTERIRFGQLLAPLPGESGLAGLWALTGLAGLSGLSGAGVGAGAGTWAGAGVTDESGLAGLWALTGLAGLSGLSGDVGPFTETGLSTELISATGGVTLCACEIDVVGAGLRGETFTEAADAKDVEVGGITTGADSLGALLGASCNST
jgi:hypothetical protein